MSGKDDLAKGADGDFRYLFTIKDLRQLSKIVEVKLLRSDSGVSPESVPKLVGPAWCVWSKIYSHTWMWTHIV
jgi:hypothetical protein